MSDREYTLHIEFPAFTDEEARRVALAIQTLLSDRVEVFLTDASDWAEHVNAMCECGRPTVDQGSIGRGKRLCQQHLDAHYIATATGRSLTSDGWLFPEHEHVGDAHSPDRCVWTIENGDTCGVLLKKIGARS